jgi:hypothetical protein
MDGPARQRRVLRALRCLNEHGTTTFEDVTKETVAGLVVVAGTNRARGLPFLQRCTAFPRPLRRPFGQQPLPDGGGRRPKLASKPRVEESDGCSGHEFRPAQGGCPRSALSPLITPLLVDEGKE